VLNLHGLRFDAALSTNERRWILVSVGHLRPEALQLIDQVPGTVTFSGFWGNGVWLLGYVKEAGPGDYGVWVNTARLDSEAAAPRRDAVVAHELGHVMEMTLVSRALRDQMVASLPSSGGCPRPRFGDCAPAKEKFADTFGKWALRGSAPAGQGYRVRTPASLDDWGAPLSQLARSRIAVPSER
jgi:hypothetical protein